VATWAEFESAVPDMAAQGRRLIYIHDVGLGYLATIRKDGGPRLHPMCPLLVDGGLWAMIAPHGPKCGDLRRDGRYAMHALSPVAVDDEFVVMGRAVETPDRAKWDAVAAAAGWPVNPDEVLFQLDIERAMLALYTHRGQWPPAYTTWRA
jgi:hypothetical protein